MVTERMIINALIIGAAFIMVPFLVSSTMTYDFYPLLFVGITTGVAMSFFVLKDTLCFWPCLGAAIGGTFNSLPLPLEWPHIFCLLLIFYYVTGYVIVRQKKIKVGKPKFFWPIMIVTLILLYHNHTLAQGAFGGTTEGGKPAFMIYIVVIAYFCGINVKPPSIRFISRIPWYFVVISFFASIPYLITSIVPSAAPFLYMFTNTVNVDAYVTSVSNSTSGPGFSGIGRLGIFGPLGGALQLYLVSRYPIGSWIRPERWWVAGLSLLCLVMAIASGFRNVLFNFAMITMLGAWCYYSWRSLFLPAFALVIATVLLIASDNNLIDVPVDKFPLIAQRTLSFLPFKWDEDALESARSSNEFRKGIRDVYIKEYMSRSPLIGNGFNIDKATFDGLSADYGSPGTQEEKAYIQSKMFIEGKLFHTGWISIYDIVGIFGSIAFLGLAFNEIAMAGHFVFGRKADKSSSLHTLYVWIFCSLVSNLISFFVVFGDIKQGFVNLCIFAIVLSQLSDIEETSEIPVDRTELRGPLDYRALTDSGYSYGKGGARY